MGRPAKIEYYLGIAKAVCKRSTCLKRHYGCIIVNNNEVIATGYNGSPRGEVNCCDIGKCKRKDVPHNFGCYSDCCSVHAEQNAMLSAARKDMIGSIMYLYGEEIIGKEFIYEGVLDGGKDIDLWGEVFSPEPCPICMRMLKNSGIKEVWFRNENDNFSYIVL